MRKHTDLIEQHMSSRGRFGVPGYNAGDQADGQQGKDESPDQHVDADDRQPEERFRDQPARSLGGEGQEEIGEDQQRDDPVKRNQRWMVSFGQFN